MVKDSPKWYYASKVEETYCTPGRMIIFCSVPHSSSNTNWEQTFCYCGWCSC